MTNGGKNIEACICTRIIFACKLHCVTTKVKILSFYSKEPLFTHLQIKKANHINANSAVTFKEQVAYQFVLLLASKLSRKLSKIHRSRYKLNWKNKGCSQRISTSSCITFVQSLHDLDHNLCLPSQTYPPLFIQQSFTFTVLQVSSPLSRREAFPNHRLSNNLIPKWSYCLIGHWHEPSILIML